LNRVLLPANVVFQFLLFYATFQIVIDEMGIEVHVPEISQDPSN